jgi:hypothetical protein
VGSYSGEPEAYAPALEFNLRVQPEGGALRRPGELKGSLEAQARRECLVMLHGYNNHRGDAGRAYLGFRNRQVAQFVDIDHARLNARLGDGFWPGDAKWPGPIDWVDFLFYPAAVGVAREAAPLLAELLWSLPNLEAVDFIAHSLGCRVALETLQLINARGYPRVNRVCLMAAAVPVEMVERDGRFEALLWDLQADRTRVHVLHSIADLVLMLAFPPGQALAGEPSTRALGRHGPSPDTPGQGGTVTDTQIPGAKHSYYWGHKYPGDDQGAQAVAQAAREAGRFLNMGAAPREFAARTVGEWRNFEPARVIGEDWAEQAYA